MEAVRAMCFGKNGSGVAASVAASVVAVVVLAVWVSTLELRVGEAILLLLLLLSFLFFLAEDRRVNKSDASSRTEGGVLAVVIAVVLKFLALSVLL